MTLIIKFYSFRSRLGKLSKNNITPRKLKKVTKIAGWNHVYGLRLSCVWLEINSAITNVGQNIKSDRREELQLSPYRSAASIGRYETRLRMKELHKMYISYASHSLTIGSYWMANVCCTDSAKHWPALEYGEMKNIFDLNEFKYISR